MPSIPLSIPEQERRYGYFRVTPGLLGALDEEEPLYQAISQLSTYTVVNGRPSREDEPKFEELRKALLIPEEYIIVGWYSYPLRRSYEIGVASLNLPPVGETEDPTWLIPTYVRDEHGVVTLESLEVFNPNKRYE